MDYEKNVCPYDVGQLLIAKEVFNLAVEQEERVHNNIHNQTILGLIEDAIMNEMVKNDKKKLNDL